MPLRRWTIRPGANSWSRRNLLMMRPSRSVCAIPEPASRRKWRRKYSSRLSRPSGTEWESACRSHALSSRPMADGFGSSPIRGAERSSGSPFGRLAERIWSMQSSGTVHVIDDDEALRESLLFLLNAAKFQVRSYESAEAFLDAMGHAEPGCIITDV